MCSFVSSHPPAIELVSARSLNMVKNNRPPHPWAFLYNCVANLLVCTHYKASNTRAVKQQAAQPFPSSHTCKYNNRQQIKTKRRNGSNTQLASPLVFSYIWMHIISNLLEMDSLVFQQSREVLRRDLHFCVQQWYFNSNLASQDPFRSAAPIAFSMRLHTCETTVV